MKCETLLPEADTANHEAELDLVVPFTSPSLTRTAIQAAEQLGGGLAASIRLIKLQVVPYQVEECPIDLEFLQEQLSRFESILPLQIVIVLTREDAADLRHTLKPESIVVLATKRRWWPTRTERLARQLRRDGHRVVLVKEPHNA